MKPEHKAEYDKLGLPWNTDSVDITDARGFWLEPSGCDFAILAANKHHDLLEQVEQLRNELSRLQAVCGEEDYMYIEDLLKETEVQK